MKRLFSFLLSVSVLLSALPPAAANEDKGTNVALNRPGFSLSHAGADHADRATDGDSSTAFYMSGGKTEDKGDFDETAWYYVDLGAEYTIDSIDLTMDAAAPAHLVGYEVYLSNTRASATSVPQAEEKTVVRAAEDTCSMQIAGGKASVTIDVAGQNITDRYRFVYVSKTDAGTNDGINLKELAVYTKDEVAPDAPYWTEIATHKPSFAASHMPGYAAFMGNDRNVATEYISRGVTPVAQRYVVDLGAQYPLSAVVFRTRESASIEKERQGYEIYGTNDNLFVDMDLFHDQGAEIAPFGNKFYAVPEEFQEKTYRYVVVQKTYSSVNAYSLDMSVKDLLVYTPEKVEKTGGSSDKTFLVSRDTPVTISCENRADYPKEYLNDNSIGNATTWLGAVGTTTSTEVYCYMDLQKPQSIDYVTYALSDFANYSYGLTVVASNDPSFAPENDAVLYEAKNADGVYFSPVKSNTTGSIILFEATEAMQGQKYRYVGMRFPANGTMVRGGASIFDVYTKQKNMDNESHNGVTFSRNADGGSVFSLSSGAFLSVTGRPYLFLAAAYDAKGALLEVRHNSLRVDKQGVYQELSSSVDFSDSPAAGSICEVKTMLWDSYDALRPVVAAQSFAVDGFYRSVTENAVSCKSNQGQGSQSYETDAKNSLADGNLTTMYGNGPAHADYYFTFLDMGESKRVDKVVITAFDQYAREKGQKYWLADTLPVKGADESGWVYLGEKTARGTAATDPAATMTFVLDETQAGNYRYIVADCRGANVGGYVNEIAVYEKISQ